MKYLLWLLFAVSLATMFVTSTEPIVGPLIGTPVEPVLYALHYPNSILFNLSVGLLASFFFWFLIVYLPERRRRAILHGWLTDQYEDFKKANVRSLLWAAGEQPSEGDVDGLTDHVAFKDYFNANNKQRWYAAMNGLEAKPDLLSEIRLSVSLLGSEISYALALVPIRDRNTYLRTRNFVTAVERQGRSIVFKNEEVKYLTGFLFNMLARWSFVTGHMEHDAFQDMIDSI